MSFDRCIKLSPLIILLFSVESYSVEQYFHYVEANDIEKSLFNPHPMKEDLVLPLPCSSSKYHIVFRKVYTNDISDKDLTNGVEFYDGSENPQNAAIQSRRRCKVRGNFLDKKGSFYYLSKYELTSGQYDAIINNKCKDVPSIKDALAKVDISIDDARHIAKLYSDFLQKIKETPSVGKEKAYASLPYECYWSFAQRGDLAVSRKELEDEASIPDINKTIKDYAWGNGADSSNGKVQVIGKKNPSVLGFFDMLGNVQEYMDEPFQATVQGDLAAQKGGSTVRGGSFMTPFSLMTNSLRTEKKRYTNGIPTKSKDTGMRLMLNVSVTLDRDNLKKLESDVIQKNSVSISKENTVKIKEQEPISPLESYKFIGSFKKVCGTVSQVFKRNDVGYINFGGHYPNQKFVVYITKLTDYADIDDLESHIICASGSLEDYKGIPQIANPLSFEVIN